MTVMIPKRSLVSCQPRHNTAPFIPGTGCLIRRRRHILLSFKQTKKFWTHGGTSLWVAPDWLLECWWSYSSLAWFDTREKWCSKTSGDTWLNIPSGPLAWKMALMLSWNQVVRLLCPKVPTGLLGWASESCNKPINPEAWLAVGCLFCHCC